MSYRQAGSIAILKKIAGWVIFLPALVSTAISLLLFSAGQLRDVEKGVGALLADIMHLVVDIARFNTSFLHFFWQNAPVPQFSQGMSSNNLLFFSIYVLIFLGMAFNASGSKILRQLSYLKEGIEAQLALEKLKGSEARTREQLEKELKLPANSVLRQYFLLYVLPIFFIVIGYFLLQVLGW